MTVSLSIPQLKGYVMLWCGMQKGSDSICYIT
jgi:hypothetical protein